MNGISRLIEAIKAIEQTGKFESDIYFRGQRKCHELLPSLLRKSLSTYKENNVYCDSWIMGSQEFKDTKNSWEILAILQHYGMPTRLLDWSKSIINALFFAVSDCIDCKTKCRNITMQKKNKNCKGNPIIWVIDSYNMISKFYPKLDLYAFTIGIDEIQDYVDIFVKSEGKNWIYKKGPIFLEIPWNNPRIKQQKGYFTFHYSKKPLEKLCPEYVKAIEITPDWKNDILEEFKYLGVNEFDVYPDLISLSRHMRRLHNL